MINKNKIFIGGLAIAVVTATVFTFSKNTEKQYTSVETVEKQSYSVQKERQLLWQQLNANVNTGLIEKSDLDAALAQINGMLKTKAVGQYKMVSFGPDNFGGRTRAICVDVNDVNVLYAGAVQGGLYKSTNKGGSWSRVDGFNENLAVSSMDMTPDGNLYIGTGGVLLGEGSIANGGSGNYGGDGVYVSSNGGGSFSKLSGTNNWDVSNVLAHPTQNKIFVVGSNMGVKIYSGGSFSNASGISNSADLSDIEISPDGTYLICGRNDTYVSSNGGESFTKESSSAGDIKPGNNARYAISHELNDDGKYNMYASLASGGALKGIFMSPDNGSTWYEIGPGGSGTFQPFGPNNQGWYDNTITVVKDKPNEILMGGVDLWHWEMTTDLSNPWGQWTRVSEWDANPTSVKYVHADQHEMKWDKEGNLYFGNDGGVFTFTPPFPEDVTYLTFAHRTRFYNTIQFYSLAVGKDGSMMGGAQDNGTIYNDLSGVDNPYKTPGQSFEVSGGDGFDCVISQLSTDGMVTSIYNTRLSRSDDRGESVLGLNVPCPAGTTPGVDCGEFHTYFGLHELEGVENSRDSISYTVPQDSLLPIGSFYVYEVASENFAIPLKDSIQNLTGSTFLLEKGTVLKAADKVQAMFALSIPGEGVYFTRDIWKFGENPQWWKVLGPENGFDQEIGPFGPQNYATSFKFSNDGKYLYVGTSAGDVWRVDGLHDAYTRREADLLELPNLSNKRTVKDGGGVTYIEPFNLDFINNSYYDPISSLELDFAINATLIYNGAGSQLVGGVAVDPNDGGHVVACLGGTGAGTNIVESFDADLTTTSTTFSSIHGAGSNALPKIPVYSAFIDKDDANTIVVGTMLGMYYTTNGGSSWTENNDEIGQIPVFRIHQDINESNVGTQLEGSVYIATHARGFWSTNQHLVSVEETANKNKDVSFTSNIEIYPNPANDVANVSFEINATTNVSVDIVSLQGKIVSSKTLGAKTQGKHRTNLNIENLPNGIYLIQVKAGNTVKTGKFIKL